MGQIWAKKWSKLKKMYCHHFYGSKLHNKLVLAVFTRCFKHLCHKWAINGPQMGQKMAKIQKIECHHFSGSKLPQIMLLAVFIRCLFPDIQIFDHFLLKSAFLGQNSSRIEIFTANPMVVGGVQHYSRHFVKN